MLKQASNTHGVRRRASFTKTFLLLFVPTTFFFVSIVASYQNLILQNEENALLLKEEARLELVRNATSRLFRNIITDLFILSEKESLVKVVRNRDKLINRVLVAREFVIYSRRKATYDQIRYIDEKGMEIVRVDFNEGAPRIIPFNRLQDKSNRHYFKETENLRKAEVYVSPMDLNIEFDKVEIPFKSTIRFLTPVHNIFGEKRGFVAINYYGDDLLDQFDALLKGGLGQPLLLDKTGLILHGRPHIHGKMVLLGHQVNFANLDLRSWEVMSAQESGRVHKEDGVYVFSTIYPLRDALNLNKRRKGLHVLAPFNERADQYKWKVASFIPYNNLKSHQTEGPLVFMILYVTIILANGIFCRSVVGYRVRKQRTEEMLRKLATRDSLTGLWNRRSLFEHGQEHIKHIKHSSSKLSVLMLDADHFNKVNDTYGHAAGDLVLKEIADRLFNAVRSIDVAARYGGEEFTVLSPRTDLPGAIHVAERIREAMEEELFDIGEEKIKVTVSVGVAELNSEKDTFQSLIERADQALYQAKMTGRNRVVSAP